MANHVYSYFFAPSWDYPPPPTGPIKLGNVITSLKRPDQPLYTAPYPSDEELISSEKKSVEFSKEKLRWGKFSVLTRFLSALGVGVDAGVRWDKNNTESFTFTTLSTTQFIPKEHYIQKAIDSSESIQRFLAASHYRKPLYVITGIKWVHGCKANTSNTRGFGGNLSAEVDGTIWSGGTVPIGGSPGFEGKREDKLDIKWEESSDFVFAFRAWKVKVEKKTGAASATDFSKGAMLGDEVEKKDRTVCVSIVSVEETKAGDVSGLVDEELYEDEEVVVCAVPKSENDYE